MPAAFFSFNGFAVSEAPPFLSLPHGSFIWIVLLLVIQIVSAWTNPLAAMHRAAVEVSLSKSR